MKWQGVMSGGRALLAALALVGLAACGGGTGADGATADSAGKRSGDSGGPEQTAQLLQKAALINSETLAAAAASVASGDAGALTKATQRVPVYRFYNGTTSAHFYTISEEEKTRVQTTLPVFRYEGVAFYVSPSADTGLSPVYRFFNGQTGVHFYSISAEEKAHIEANLPQFRYEGVAYLASMVAATGTIPLYRFYQNQKGFHFYTASQAESDKIRATLPQYTFENVGYYVFPSAVQTYPLSFVLSGMQSGDTLVLQNNGGDDLSVSADGTFEFATQLPVDAVYNVTVKTQPIGRFCKVTSGQGTVRGPLTSIFVACGSGSNPVAGTVSGLAAGQSVRLSFNNSTAITVSANGSVTFASSAPTGSSYSVVVVTQPVGQTCTVNNGIGVVDWQIVSVQIVCSAFQYPVGGSVSGLSAGQPVVLQNNGGADLSVAANGAFTFATSVAHGSGYAVTVKTPPVGQTCSVSAGSGTATAAVTSVQVVCAANQYTVGGTMSGLPSGKTVVLQNTTGRLLSVVANGAFTFVDPVAHASTYGVTIKSQPAGLSCSVSNGSGTATSAVTSLVVSCSVNTYSVGGSVSGLGAGNALVLQNNGAGDLSRAANGAFTFATNVAYGAIYAVTVKTQPVGQVCNVTNGSGTITAAVSTVQVVCVTNQYTIGGTVSGLGSGKTLVLQNNGAGDLSRGANGAFVFTASVAHGAAYAVTVKTQPVGQNCSVAAGAGTATANVTTVAITCSTNTYSVGGSISGLGSGKSLVLQNNAGNDLTRAANGNFAFTALVPYGSPYAVSIKTQPVDQTCTVSNGLGTVAGLVSSVAVSCADHVSVSGTVSGLTVGIPVVLTLNGGSDTLLSLNGGFSMLGRTPLGAVYVVAVKTQPRGQTCTVTNGTGTANAAINNVVVQCANNPLTNLVISEVGGCPYTNSACWLEVFNPTATTLNLSNYRLRTGQAWATPSVFDLPSVSIAPGQYRILAGHLNAEAPVTALNPVVMVGNASAVPLWGQYSGTGLVELVGVASGATVDAIRFGSVASAPQPLTADHWNGFPVGAAFTGGEADQALSLVRPVASIGSVDTNSAVDWVAVEYPTPGGANDVGAGAGDADNDGLPDANEMPGTTYNGLNIYAMGARVNQRDIFVELDHMDTTGPSFAPQQATMQTLVNAFAARGFALHMDAGEAVSAVFSPAQFNLGQGSGKVPYQACLGWSTGDCPANTSTHYRTVYDWKWQHFDPRRRAIFHYGLFGDQAASGESGRAEIFGNDFTITAGSYGGGWPGTIMHELGHNLGLQHGGNESLNYKTNYMSVMNYLYGSGVPTPNTVGPYRDWRYLFGTSSGNTFCVPGNTDPLCSTATITYSIDYSDGTGLPLNENALYESANVGRGAVSGVYADWNEDKLLTSAPIARDLNGDGVLQSLTDHNDWAAIDLPFVRRFQGQLFYKSARNTAARNAAKVSATGATVPNPLTNDRGPTVVVCHPEPQPNASAANKRGQLGSSGTRLTQPAVRRR